MILYKLTLTMMLLTMVIFIVGIYIDSPYKTNPLDPLFFTVAALTGVLMLRSLLVLRWSL